MIDEKKIEEAAETKAIEGGFLEAAPIVRMAFSNGFEAGINWFLDNLWHEGVEAPREKNKNILMFFESYSVGERECDFDEYYELSHTGKDGFNNNTWRIFCDAAGWCSRWLYIDDLLKGGK